MSSFKGKLLMWLPGDITAGGFLLGLAASLGKVSNLDQMKEVINFAVDSIGANALKYTNQNSGVQMESKAVDAVIFWNGQARFRVLQRSHRMGIPQWPNRGNTPSMATCGFRRSRSIRCWRRLFIDWRLSDACSSRSIPGESPRVRGPSCMKDSLARLSQQGT